MWRRTHKLGDGPASPKRITIAPLIDRTCVTAAFKHVHGHDYDIEEFFSALLRLALFPNVDTPPRCFRASEHRGPNRKVRHDLHRDAGDTGVLRNLTQLEPKNSYGVHAHTNL